jgi:hypothetical protein
MQKSDILDLKNFLDLSVEELIALLAAVTNLRINAANILAMHTKDYDRTISNRYYQSQESSHAGRLREAEYYAQEFKDECTEFAAQVAIHALTAEFLTNLIEWRTRGIESSSRLQRREQGNPAQTGSVQGSRERDPGGGSSQGQQVREAQEPTLEPSVT